jgi:uncharacterized protein involved in response to NO
MGTSGTTLTVWIAASANRVRAGLALVAAAFDALRLARWAGERTGAEPLVTVLHIAFAFIPLGFVLVALGSVRLDVVNASGAPYAWTVGAIGFMTLAVMTRASLGRTGRPLPATPSVQAIYMAAGVAALTRIDAASDLMLEPMLQFPALAWVIAFVGFVIIYVPLLACRRS